MKEKEILGTVVSTLEGPSPSGIDFVVNNGKAHKGMFIELEYSEGTMVCLVNEVIKTNRYFERPDSVKEIGEEIEKHFPVAEWEFLLGKAKPLGVFSNVEGIGIQRSTFPPSPGTKVFKADDERLKKFLGIDSNGLALGSMQFHNVGVKPSLSKLLQKHLAIFATSGAGKSYLVSVLLEELLERKKEQGQIAAVMIDLHGEYTSFGEPLSSSSKPNSVDYSSRTRIIDGSKMTIGCSKLNTGLLSSILPKMSSNLKRELATIIDKLYKEMKSGVGPFDLANIRTEIQGIDNDKTVSALLSAVFELEQIGLFSKIDYPSISDLVKQGQLTVFDLSKITSEKKKQVLVSYIARRLFNDRKSGRVPPLALFVEEAHNFIPEKRAEEHAIAKSILRTIAREGRKFGASLVVISQRPVHLDTTTLANCNTNIILRITNPYDLKHIAESSEGLDSQAMGMVSSLRVGEALIVGEALNAPTFFKVRLRKSAPSRHESTLEDSAKRYSEQQGEEKEEAESFL